MRGLETRLLKNPRGGGGGSEGIFPHVQVSYVDECSESFALLKRLLQTFVCLAVAGAVECVLAEVLRVREWEERVRREEGKGVRNQPARV